MKFEDLGITILFLFYHFIFILLLFYFYILYGYERWHLNRDFTEVVE